MTHIVNSLIRPLGWLIVPCKHTRKLFVTWLIAWIFLPTVFMVAQPATPESNKQAIEGHNFRLVRLEDKAEHIAEVMTSIKYLEEKIDDVTGIQKLVLFGVMGALALNLLNIVTKRHQDLLHMVSKKHSSRK